MSLTVSEILELLPANNLYNLHSHTQFCDSRHSMELILQGAIGEGMTLFGFSPHSPVPIESPCNMLKSDVPVYLAEMERLARQYSGQVKLLAAMEIDYLGPDWGPSHPYFDTVALDYRIGSVHFIPDINGLPVDIDGSSERFLGNMRLHFDNDIDFVINRFFDQTEAMIEAGGFQIIGHFDKVLLNAVAFDPHVASSPLYQNRLDRAIDCIAASGIIAEINTKHRQARGYFFPAADLWPRLQRAGIPLVVNSDVHYRELTNAGRPEALTVLGGFKHSF